MCICEPLTRSYLAAASGLVKEAESGFQLTAVCQDSQAEQKDTAGATCVCISLANRENALSLLHTLSSPEKSLPTERLLPSQASFNEEGFNPSMCLSLSAPADVSLNMNFPASSLPHFIQV